MIAAKPNRPPPNSPGFDATGRPEESSELSTRGRRILVVGVLLILLAACHLPFSLVARHRLYFSVDELELTETAADRFLGVPENNLHWPGTINNLLLEPVIVANYLIHVRGSASADSFVNYLSSFYRSPWRLFLISRLFLMMLASLGLALILPNLAVHTGDLGFAAAGLLLIGTVPAFLYQSSGAFAATPGFAALCVSIAIALTPAKQEEFEPYIAAGAGIFFGLSLAGRNVMMPALPFVAALLAIRSDRWLRAVVVCCVAAMIAFAASCPSLWMEPVRWAKANLGNYLKHGQSVGFQRSAVTMIAVITPWLFAAFCAALIILLRNRRWVIAGGAIASALAMVVAAARSPVVADRYFSAMIIVAGITACIGIIPELTRLRRHIPRPALYTCAGGVAVIVLALNLAGTHTRLERTFGIDGECPLASGAEVAQLRSAVSGYQNRKLLVPIGLIPWVTDLASRRSLEATADNALQVASSRDSAAQYTESYGLADADTKALFNDFDEKTQSFAARFAIMAGGADHGSVDIVFYAPADTARRFGLLTDHEAMEALAAGRFDAAVVSLGATRETARSRQITSRIGIVSANPNAPELSDQARSRSALQSAPAISRP